jgi:hypothetical protein
VAAARERRAFGRAIAEFQGRQFLLRRSRREAARWLAYRAAWLFDQGRPETRACAIAKRVGVDAAEEVARKALEVFGASGLRRDRPVERYMRWAKVTAFIDGTPQVQQLVIARDLLREAEEGGLLPRGTGAQAPGFSRGSLTSVQSSTPSMLGVAAVVVVSVRPLLGENQTYSFEPWPPFTPAASISGPLVPLSRRSAFRARFASCLALR